MRESGIYDALSKVQHVRSQKDIVSLDLVKNIHIEGDNVSFTLVLDNANYSTEEKGRLRNGCQAAIQAIYPSAKVLVSFGTRNVSKRSDPKMFDKSGALDGIKNVIAVFSGKGGVGKSTIAVNLALAIASKGDVRVGLMDADIYGPSGHIMLGVRGERPRMQDIDGKPKIVPIRRYGISMMSIGLLVDEAQAVVWRGPMVSSAIRQFTRDVNWGELDYLIIDMPPGTGDIHLTIAQSVPVTGVVIVTTPQLVALADAKKGVAMFNQPGLKVPILGLVENMSYFTPPELPDNKYYIFGKEGGKKMAEESGIPFLGEIPIVETIREGGDIGVPAMMGDDPITIKAFMEFGDNVIKGLDAINEMNKNSVNFPVL